MAVVVDGLPGKALMLRRKTGGKWSGRAGPISVTQLLRLVGPLRKQAGPVYRTAFPLQHDEFRLFITYLEYQCEIQVKPLEITELNV